MPRCYILKKAHAQHNPIQPYGKRTVRNSKGKTTTTITPNNATKRNIISNNNNNNNGSNGSNSESCDKKNQPHIRVAVIQKASRTTAANKLRSKCNNNVDKRAPRSIRETPLNDSTSNNCHEYYDDNNEWKSTTMQRKKLLSSTHAMAQQNCKNKQSGPTSPTEASIAPIYYSNGDANDSKNASSSSSTPSASRPHESIECTETSSMVCRPIPSVIHKSQTTFNAQINMKKSKVHQTSTLSSPTVTFAPMKLSPKSTEISAIVSNPNTERQYFYESSTSSISSSTIPTIAPSNEYSLLRLASTNNNNHHHHNNIINNINNNTTPMGSIYRERSIEETEAAHDLLSLSQSLPPLPAPCVVTILHSVNNYNVNSPDVHEIAPTTKDYITYTSNTINTNNMPNNKSIHSTNYPVRSEQTAYGMYVDDNNTTTQMLPTNNNNNNKKLELKTQITPLTPPTSESSSSSDVELVNETSINNHLDYNHGNEIMDPVSNGKHANQKLSQKIDSNNSNSNSSSTNSKSAQVFGMTIFDAVMINDGRSKKGNGDAEVIHIEERRKGRYKCPQCGKQYATSSNLSRHKQTHRSLDSQSAKKCMTCGKAYVSMPALAMHLLTHKLTHSCDVCGKLFSRPWLLQGHLRSHTGEKPYGCAHCGKAFADRSNLRAHMQTHSVNKQFECTRCRKTFALKSYLNKHLESSCLREEMKKSTDSKIRHLSSDDDTIDVTDTDQMGNSSDDYDEDEDIIVT